MAAHIRSNRILRSGDSFGHSLVDSGNFPSSRVAAVCALYRDTGGLGSRGRLDLRQALEERYERRAWSRQQCASQEFLNVKFTRAMRSTRSTWGDDEVRSAPKV
jgi:hypothetical protein